MAALLAGRSRRWHWSATKRAAIQVQRAAGGDSVQAQKARVHPCQLAFHLARHTNGIERCQTCGVR